MPGNEIREQQRCIQYAYVVKEGYTCKSGVGPLGQGQEGRQQGNYYPVSNYEIEWAHIRPSVIQVTNNFVEPM